jgi:DNA-binding NarL/FixJ family response regulator
MSAPEYGGARGAVGPLLIVAGSIETFEHAIRELERQGIAVVRGFHEIPTAGRVVRAGAVADTDGAEAALMAALRGEGLIVHASGPTDVLDRLTDDLRRLGPVDDRAGNVTQAPVLSPDARAILGLLAEGYSLGEAAALLGLSRRTADRRLAEGRKALGVDRTTEAVARARRLGWFGEQHPVDV